METVKLNVGGRHFEVSRALLKAHPNSNLADLITDKNEDVDEMFIDRDGDIFQHVLQYLRNGKVSLPSAVPIDSFIAEMEFFKLEFERSNILPDGSKNDTNTKEDERASSPKHIFGAKFVSGYNASAHASSTTDQVGGFHFNNGSLTKTKESKDTMASGFGGLQQETVSTNASKGGNSGGFPFGFNGTSAQTPMFGKPKQESHNSLAFPSTSAKAPLVVGPTTASNSSSTASSFTFTNASIPFGSKGTINDNKNIFNGFKEDFKKNATIKYGSSVPFVFKGLDNGQKTSIKTTQSSQGNNSKTPRELAIQLLDKICGGFDGSEDEHDALAIFDSFDRSKSGRINVSDLFDYCQDEGEDFYKYDEHSKIINERQVEQDKIDEIHSSASADPDDSNFFTVSSPTTDSSSGADFCFGSSKPFAVPKCNPFVSANFASTSGSTSTNKGFSFGIGSSTGTSSTGGKSKVFDFGSKSTAAAVTNDKTVEEETKEAKKETSTSSETKANLSPASAATATAPSNTETSVKSKQTSQETNSDAAAHTAQRLFEKVHNCFPSSGDGSNLNEDEQNALTAFDSLDVSETGRIKVSQLLFLFDDIGEDFHGDEYDKQSQILDPKRSGFIERSTFIDWYRKLSSRSTSKSKDKPESEVEKKDHKESTSHSIPYKISSTDQENPNRITSKSNEKDDTSEEIGLLKRESEIAKKYEREGKYDEAVPIFRRCLLISEAIHGLSHPDTLSFMSDLASVLERKEEYGKAEHIYKKCLSKREENLGSDHQDTLFSISSLANVYRLQKKYDKAEKLYDLYLPKMKTILGPDHHCTFLSMHGLGALYFDKGENTKAEANFVDCLVKSEKVLGSDHPVTLNIVNTLAVFYLRQSDIAKARPLLLTTFSKRMTFLGSKHPDTMHTMSSVAKLYSMEDEYEMAESLFKDCIAMNKENHGPKHRITLMSMLDLAGFYDTQGEYDKSGPLYDECLTERRKILGPDHPQTLNCMCSWASSYKSQRKYEFESSLLQKVLSSRQKTLGNDHPDSVFSMAQLGISLVKSGKEKERGETEVFLSDSLSKQKEILGTDHPDTLEVMNSLGRVYFRKSNTQNIQKAKQIWEDCLSRRKKVLGPNHESTLETMENLIQLYSRLQDKHNEAETLYRDCLARRKETLGPDNPVTLNTMFNFGQFLYDSKQAHEEAMELLHECWFKRKDILGANHSDTIRTRQVIQGRLNNLQRRGIQLSKNFQTY